jgi:hypothetical protein
VSVPSQRCRAVTGQATIRLVTVLLYVQLTIPSDLPTTTFRRSHPRMITSAAFAVRRSDPRPHSTQS